MKKARLVLDNGMVFEGNSIGAESTMFGELVFNTSMVGYQEILTDPSYASQVIVMTYPEIGNTGINPHDFESGNVYARGLIVKSYCENDSHYLASQTLKDYLKQHGIVGISGIDTRALTRILRENGTMNCVITTENVSERLIDELSRYKVSKDLILMTTRKKAETFYCDKSVINPTKIAIIDYGMKAGILNNLQKFDCEITVFPADVTADTILKGKFDALFLSNGPGDPADCVSQIKVIKELIGSIPMFGICLGYQLLALALGAKTYKLKYGHRGGNHPVVNIQNKKVMLTSQNHGYAVDAQSLTEHSRATYQNLNDGTLEGFDAEKLRIFAVQFHPEVAPGPSDAGSLFEYWISKIETFRKVPSAAKSTLKV